MTSISKFVDFTKISFPSDRLTLGQFRRAHPDAFDIPSKGLRQSLIVFDRGSVEYPIGSILDAERLLASRAFKKASKQELSKDEVALSREELVLSLIESFRPLGYGREVVRQFVRDIESQAVSQVNVVNK
jgi:hypothetical protein